MSERTSTVVRRWCFILEKLTSKSAVSRQELEDCINANSLDVTTARSVQRDIKRLIDDFDIPIERKGRSYLLAPEQSSKVKVAVRFFELVLSSGDGLLSIADVKSGTQHFLPGTEPLKNLNYISPILSAITHKKCISFVHRKFDGSLARTFILSPYKLKEYLGRWYVYGKLKGKPKNCFFGIDRISGLAFDETKYEATNQLDDPCHNVIGVMIPSETKPDTIVLRYTKERGNYIKTLPLHHSQKILEETDEHTTVEITVVPNCDLIDRILKDGPNVFVVQPQSLASEVRELLEKAVKQYLSYFFFAYLIEPMHLLFPIQ